MSLSSSTLSLKFMQRGLARNAPSTPTSAPSTPGQQRAPTSTAGSTSTPTQARASSSFASSSKVAAGSVLTPEVSASMRGDPMLREEEGRWFMPRSTSSRDRHQQQIMKTEEEEEAEEDRRSSSNSGRATRMVFENSYVPFISSTAEFDPVHQAMSRPWSDRSNENAKNASMTGGGGRMVFGGFGKKDTEEDKVRGGDGNGDEDEDMSDDDDGAAVDVKREKGKTKLRHVKTEPSSTSLSNPSRQRPTQADTSISAPSRSPPIKAETTSHAAPRTFLRPALSPPPSSAPVSNSSSSSKVNVKSEYTKKYNNNHNNKQQHSNNNADSPRPATSMADQMRQTISSNRSKQPHSPVPIKTESVSSGGGEKKRDKKRSAPAESGSSSGPGPSTGTMANTPPTSNKKPRTEHPQQPASTDGAKTKGRSGKKGPGAGMSLDEREKALKAEKKKAKKAAAAASAGKA
ncbi:hypothetical protein I317_05249 [Kwoniella heveanensis CBS 569]|nr:hypothetical protein I317_05249 [Kwoniella heveanensis CBS 569]